MPLIRLIDIEDSKARKRNKKDINLSKTEKMVCCCCLIQRIFFFSFSKKKLVFYYLLKSKMEVWHEKAKQYHFKISQRQSLVTVYTNNWTKS